MQKLFTCQEAADVLEHMEMETAKKILLKGYLSGHNTASFEPYPGFDLCCFDWYDVCNDGADTNRIRICFGQDDLFIFCTNEDIKEKLRYFMDCETAENEQALHHFLFTLLERDMDYIDDYEDTIIEAEGDALLGRYGGYMGKIPEYRKELLRMKRYYAQLQIICDGLINNENKLIGEEALLHFNILHNRVDRCYAAVLNLQDYVSQMREAYQAQIDIEQNELMKVFTLITALFLPLSLMVGWYGMNFTHMPELASVWGYPVFILVSIIISIVLIIYFKKKKWF